MDTAEEVVDFLVVGGGAVGLHAALKAAILRQSVVVVDKGARFSRVSQARAIANVPMHPGISGPALLAGLRRALAGFASRASGSSVHMLDDAEVTRVERVQSWAGAPDARGPASPRFRARVATRDGEREVLARVIVLATGVVDRKPGIETFGDRGHETLAPVLHRGEVAYCLLCEGWSVAGASLAIVGASEESAQIAEDLRAHFDGDVTLLTDASTPPGEATRAALERARVRIDERAIESYASEKGERVRVAFGEGPDLVVDKLFFTLGFYRVNNDIAVRLGGATTREGFVVTDEAGEVLDAQGARIEGLFAVGDVRAGRWKQIVVGWGDAETAVITAYAKRLPDPPRD